MLDFSVFDRIVLTCGLGPMTHPNDSHPVLSRRQVREFDQIAINTIGIHSLVLMENAARGAVDCLCGQGINGPIAIFCGSGNNGGDGLAMARHLRLRGFHPIVYLLAKKADLSQDSAVNLRILEKMSVSIYLESEVGDNVQPRPDWVVDALLGTGARLPLRPPLAEWIERLNQIPCRKLAVDIPTGLECDVEDSTRHATKPVFQADRTVTFVARKQVMETEWGQRICGAIDVIDIGAPHEIFGLLSKAGATAQKPH